MLKRSPSPQDRILMPATPPKHPRRRTHFDNACVLLGATKNVVFAKRTNGGRCETKSTGYARFLNLAIGDALRGRTAADLAKQSRRGTKSPASLRPPTPAILAKRNTPFYASEISTLQSGFRAAGFTMNFARYPGVRRHRKEGGDLRSVPSITSAPAMSSSPGQISSTILPGDSRLAAVRRGRRHEGLQIRETFRACSCPTPRSLEWRRRAARVSIQESRPTFW